MSGTYIEELPEGPPPIIGVPTSVTGFVGRAPRGPVDQAVPVSCVADYEAAFGGPGTDSPLGRALQDFFTNGGRHAVVVNRSADGDGLAPTLPALDAAPDIGLLCLPPDLPDGDVDPAVLTAALAWCETHGVLLIVDPPASWTSVQHAVAGVGALLPRTSHAALYFPRLRSADPLRRRKSAASPPCGAVAGLIARTDEQRGIWTAPDGPDAVLEGVDGPALALTSSDLGRLNPLGINTIRLLPGPGHRAAAVWGGRTLAGDVDPQWRYVSVRRLFLFLERSIDRGLQWAVFEPNDEPLWANVRRVVQDFLFALFLQGAFAGTTPDAAFFVRCDRSTMTQPVVDAGRLVCELGVAPRKPAEFVVLRIVVQVSEPRTPRPAPPATSP